MALAQLAEHRSPKPGVAGSNPAGRANGVRIMAIPADFDSADGGSIPPRRANLIKIIHVGEYIFYTNWQRRDVEMTDVKIFSSEEFGEVRTVIINDEPWFVGKDVAKILGYKDTSDALKKHVDEEDKLTRRFADSGQNREMYVINESGLYSLILSSKLAKAKQFKRWVTSEILPSIRKHGAYATPDTIESILKNPDFGIQLLQKLKEEIAARERAEAENARLGQIVEDQREVIDVMAPKSRYHDLVWNNPGDMTISQIAKDYGKSAQWLNKYLSKKGIQYKKGNTWLPYQKYANMGIVHTHTTPLEREMGIMSISSTHWTPKGRIFVYETLKIDGVLPLCELDTQVSIGEVEL